MDETPSAATDGETVNGPTPGAEAERYAWAKVNLYLHVTGKRDDGYHELDSLIVFAGVGDRLTLEPADRFEVKVEGPFASALPPGETNLIEGAARFLAGSAGALPSVRVRLEKRLPVAAGIGGGSADAAAALALLAPLMPEPRAQDWVAIANELGADVPVCLYGRPGFVSGIGERIERAPPLPPVWLVLANPGLPLSTAAVFRARDEGFSVARPWQEAVGDPGELAERLSERRNDLEAPARRLLPEVDLLLDALAATEGCLLARMSGSGATCFGLYADRASAELAAAALVAERPGWWAAAAPLLHGPLSRSWWESSAA